MDMSGSDLAIALIDVVLGVIAGLPLPLALLSRRSLERSWYALSRIARVLRSALHILLMLLGVVVPWSTYWVLNRLEQPATPIHGLLFVIAIIATFVVLTRRWRLYDSKTWKFPIND
jgi:hypothetical protein